MDTIKSFINFSLTPRLCVLNLPTTEDSKDFDIPDTWKPFQNFREIEGNVYRSVCRPKFNEELHIRQCSCTNEVGCGINCENWRLYM